MNSNKIFKVCLISTITFLLLCVLGITYAYFSLEIEGTSKDMVVTTGDLRIRYTDNDEINFNNAVPGDFVTKEVTIENVGTKDVIYALFFNKFENEIENGELVLSSNCIRLNSNGVEEGTCEGISESGLLTISNITPIIKNDISIEVGVTHKYTLTLTFKDTGEEQNYNKNKKFNANIGVNESFKDIVDTLTISNNFTIENYKVKSLTFSVDDVSSYNSDKIIYEIYRTTEGYNGNYTLLENGLLENKSEKFQYVYNEGETEHVEYYYKIVLYNEYYQKIAEKIDNYLYCFVAGTKVLTDDGYINIEDIKVGDKVYSYNLDNNTLELKKVLNTAVSSTIDTYIVYINNKKIEMTPKHQVYIIDKGWVRASELKVGDKLLSSNKEVIEITDVKYKKYDKAITTYNLTVEDNSNYFVSDFQVLVHNSSPIF